VSLRGSFARRPRVLDEVAGRVRREFGELPDQAPDRVAVLVHYSASPRVNRSFRTLVRDFADAGYLPLIVSAATPAEPLQWGGGLPDQAVVLRKPNLGYDFGSWAVGLHELPSVLHSPYVVLANDSVLGPFQSLKPHLDAFEQSDADVWGLTDTRQYFHHLQSYFLGFRRGVLADKPLARFWADRRIESTKWEIIRRNELALNLLLRNEGYVATAAFRADDVVPPGENPVIRAWWKLIENGFPFIKREIVTNPSVAPRSDWVTREVKAYFGEDINEWL
jgi:hypothetical protein